MTSFAALLARSRNADQGFYLLIDPQADRADDSPLHPDKLLARLPAEAIAPVLRADLAHDTSACPKLITLAEAGQRFDLDALRLTVNTALAEPIGGKRMVCGWLNSPSPLAVLAEDLAQRCLVPDQDAQRVIPLFEPLRLELLAVSLRERMGSWLNPITQWIVPNSAGRLLQLRSHNNTPTPVFDTADMNAQHLAPLVGNVLTAWKRLADQPMPADARVLAPLMQDKPGPATHAAAKVLSHLRRTHVLGLRNASDRVTFALKHLTVHPHLETHPRIQQCIQEAVAGKARLLDSFAALGTAEWRDVLYTLNRVRS
ncbi:hypothetical protein [Achromobacter sp. ESBL13]|uniref:hypothetical protein n=1 Tax=Achromobacter sp. ESBL13 TaxID=3077328 RepID=UPI002FC93C2A